MPLNNFLLAAINDNDDDDDDDDDDDRVAKFLSLKAASIFWKVGNGESLLTLFGNLINFTSNCEQNL